MSTMDLREYALYLAEWIKESVTSANAKGVVFGLSGGVDSAVVAALAKIAFPSQNLSVFLPVGDMGIDLIDAKAVATQLGLKSVLVDLTTTHQALVSAAKLTSPLAIANSKSRLRMSTLYALAQEHNYLVLGTSNAAEWKIGYFTKYGDGAADILPLIHLHKHEVQELAKIFSLPEAVYTKVPTAALWPGQSLQTEHGYSYQDVDAVLENKSVESAIANKISKQHQLTSHKREMAKWPQAYKRS